MDDATGLAEALVGLDGFRVLDVRENPDEVCITVETTADVVGCPRCGVRALAKERKRVDIRDLPCFGRPARLVWLKRRWCCADPDCEQKTWTEGSPTSRLAPCSPCVPVPRPRARWVRWPSPSPSSPASSGCAGGPSWTPSSSTAPRSSRIPLG